MKEFGKAKIFLYNQAKIPDVDHDELERMKTELRERREDEKEMLEEIKTLNAQVAAFNA